MRSTPATTLSMCHAKRKVSRYPVRVDSDSVPVNIVRAWRKWRRDRNDELTLIVRVNGRAGRPDRAPALIFDCQSREPGNQVLGKCESDFLRGRNRSALSWVAGFENGMTPGHPARYGGE